jgi:peptide/nickel transport system substrate-binding protein
VATCRAVAADLAAIGVRITLRAAPRAQFFTRLLDPGLGSRFYLMGWRPANDDAIDALVNLAATRNDVRHSGAYNIGGYANPALDAIIVRARRAVVGNGRTALLRDALAIVKDDDAYLPLYQPDVVWAVRDNVELVQRGDGSFPLRDVRMK